MSIPMLASLLLASLLPFSFAALLPKLDIDTRIDINPDIIRSILLNDPPIQPDPNLRPVLVPIFDRVPDSPIIVPGDWILPNPFPRSLIFPNVTGNWSVPKPLCVRVNQAPVDVYFLADTTGSMGGHIAAVKSAAASMHASLTAALTNLRIGVGAYKDVGDVYVFKNFQSVASLTAAQFSTALTGWVASGGGDTPEAQLYAMQQVATQPAINWRSSSIKVVVWFGDAPGHDPSLGVSLALAKANLLAASIKTIALDCSLLNQGGQANSLASATGGQYYPSISAANIAATMVSSLGNVAVTIKPVVTCPANTPIVIKFDPPTINATALKPGCFNVSVKACNDLQCARRATYTCTVNMVDTSNNQVIASYPITAVVPGTDTTPPVFTPGIMPMSLLVECPYKYPFPKVKAIDDCDDNPSVKQVTSSAQSSSCPAEFTTTSTWTATDDSGNSVSVSQSVTYQDTTPPFIKPSCNNLTLCLNETSDFGSVCISMRRYSECFGDACSTIKPPTFGCGNCSTPANSPFTFSCTEQSSDVLCFSIKGMPREQPFCCNLKASVTDACGNTATYAFPKVCVYSRLTGPPSPNTCGGGIYTLSPTATGGGK